MKPQIYTAFIEFSRNVKSREELNAFEKYCKSEPTLKRHFVGTKGRKFIFGYAQKKERDSFYYEAEKMLKEHGLITQRVTDNQTK